MWLELKRFTLESTLEPIVAIERSLAVVMTLAFTPLAAFALDVSVVGKCGKRILSLRQ